MIELVKRIIGLTGEKGYHVLCEISGVHLDEVNLLDSPLESISVENRMINVQLKLKFERETKEHLIRYFNTD